MPVSPEMVETLHRIAPWVLGLAGIGLVALTLSLRQLHKLITWENEIIDQSQETNRTAETPPSR